MLQLLKKYCLPITLATVLFGSSSGLSAQGYFQYSTGIYEPEILIEAGINLGIMNGVTDIQGNPRVYQGPFAGVTLLKTNFSTGLYAIASYRNVFGVRLEANMGRIEGYDSLLTNATAPSAIGRYERNLNFRSPIREVMLMGELHLPQLFRSYDKTPYRLSPYIMAGISWFTFNPRAYTANGWVDLHPLRLEGQGFAEYPNRKQYRLNSFAYPVGIGFRYDVSPKLTMRFEINKRTAFTDYIDDVHQGDWVDPNLFANYLSASQAALARQLYNRSTIHTPPRDTRPRGNPNENDAYWTAVIKFGLNLNRSGYNSGIFGGQNKRDMRKRLRCPNL
ncbi:MAG: DUF6089 family protein [Bacteroidetes bacterium]|uniref:DUF6089 family protein n=1 Tax=Phnomibacter sp. TaxID=2836217 RepID=UPI002FDE871B|nr:DUF6089 family protein [Bacteroidota bacterium]